MNFNLNGNLTPAQQYILMQQQQQQRQAMMNQMPQDWRSAVNPAIREDYVNKL
jgi:hypothetical protein